MLTSLLRSPKAVLKLPLVHISTAVSSSKSESCYDEEEKNPNRAVEEIVPASAPEEVTVASTEVSQAEPIESSKYREEIVETETVVESDEILDVNTTK